MGVCKTSLWIYLLYLYLWQGVKTPALLKPELGEEGENPSILLPLERNALHVMLCKRNKACLVQAILKDLLFGDFCLVGRFWFWFWFYFFHLLPFQMVESFSNVKEVWKLEKLFHRQNLRRRKQVANINMRAISSVFWVEQWLGRTALWLTGLTNS